MAGGSNGYRAALARHQRTPGLISSLPGTVGLPPFISFSISCPELDCRGVHPRANKRISRIADGVIFGSPTRYGNMTAQMKSLIDSTAQLWLAGAMEGKPAGVFTSTA